MGNNKLSSAEVRLNWDLPEWTQKSFLRSEEYLYSAEYLQGKSEDFESNITYDWIVRKAVEPRISVAPRWPNDCQFSTRTSEYSPVFPNTTAETNSGCLAANPAPIGPPLLKLFHTEQIEVIPILSN